MDTTVQANGLKLIIKLLNVFLPSWNKVIIIIIIIIIIISIILIVGSWILAFSFLINAVFFPLFRSLSFSLPLHYLNAWNRLEVMCLSGFEDRGCNLLCIQPRFRY